MGYAGDASKFPAELPLLSDLSLPTGSVISVPVEALTDRTAYLHERLQFDFTAKEALADCEQAVWSEATQRWWSAGGTKIVKSSLGGGWQFDAASALASGAYTGYALRGIAVDGSGNAVATSDGGDTAYFELNASSGVWTERTSMAVSLTSKAIAFDPGSGHFISAGKNGAPNQLKVQSTPDRVAWVERAVPSEVHDAIATLAGFSLATNGAGRTLLVRGPSSAGAAESRVRIAYSDNATSWSYAGETSTDIVLETTPKLASNGGTTWLMPFYRTTGGVASRIMRSTDNGATWELAKSLSTVAVFSIVHFRGMWVAMTIGGELLFSKDDGSSWRRLLARVSTPAKGLFAGPYGVLAVGNAEVWPSARAALDNLAVVT